MTSSYKFHVTWVASQCSQWNASGTAFLEMLILLMEMLDISSMFKFRWNSALSGYSGAMLKLHGHCQVADYCTRWFSICCMQPLAMGPLQCSRGRRHFERMEQKPCSQTTFNWSHSTRHLCLDFSACQMDGFKIHLGHISGRCLVIENMYLQFWCLR